MKIFFLEFSGGRKRNAQPQWRIDKQIFFIDELIVMHLVHVFNVIVSK